MPGTRRGVLGAVLLDVLLAGALVHAGAAQSPGTSPAVSSAPADCGPVAARLPPTLDDLVLHVTITDGVAAIDPDELLDPLLVQLGRARRDVCLVAFRYGDGSDEIPGQLLRVSGVDAALDLAEAFATSISTQLAGYGARASAAPESLDGEAVWRVAIVADDQSSEVLARQLGDTLLLTADDAGMRRLLPVIGAVPDVSPVPSTPPDPGDGGSPAASAG